MHTFLTSALDGGEWSASCTGSFTLREEAQSTHLIGGWGHPTWYFWKKILMERKSLDTSRNPCGQIAFPCAICEEFLRQVLF